jgi:MoxR-like ATPase
MDSNSYVRQWSQGRARLGEGGALVLGPRRPDQLSEKLRRAYAWLSQNALVAPQLDLGFGDPVQLGRGGVQLDLYPQGYASYLLLPLLTLATSQRLLFVGAPGRGKTTLATLMGLLAGGAPRDVRRQVQHGHPQLTIADLLGSPLPSELLRAQDAREIKVSWRGWLTARVKIVDEYNRIPTKTQSALLSLMAEGYAELYEQVVEAGKGAWFLTANDDAGGGTFQVIDALKDRLDATVRSLPFHTAHLEVLAARVASGAQPGNDLPSDLVFTHAELDQLEEEIRAVPLPKAVQEVLGFFAGQLEFCGRASAQPEFMTKDTLHLAGRRLAHVCTEECPLDKQVHLCTQTESGVSARAYQALMLYAKALACFRGEREVSVEDVRALLPWVLHERLVPNAQSAFFQRPEHQVLLLDKAAWIRQLFDKATVQQAAYARVRAPIHQLKAELDDALARYGPTQTQGKLSQLQAMVDELLRKNELSGPVQEDLLLLKSLHGKLHTHLRSLGPAARRLP